MLFVIDGVGVVAVVIVVDVVVTVSVEDATHVSEVAETK